MTKRMVLAAAASVGALVLGVSSAVAQTTGAVINVGEAFGSLSPYINSAVSALIMVGLTLLFLLLKQKFNVDIDKSTRDSLEVFLKNQASSLIAQGAVKFGNTGISVQSAPLAAAANMALKFIPDAMQRFGLTPEVIQSKIIAAIPQNPTAAATAATSDAAVIPAKAP